MSDRNELVPKNVLRLTALRRIRMHDAPIRRRSRFYFKKIFQPQQFVAAPSSQNQSWMTCGYKYSRSLRVGIL
jgi:hypothetical protein